MSPRWLGRPSFQNIWKIKTWFFVQCYRFLTLRFYHAFLFFVYNCIIPFNSVVSHFFSSAKLVIRTGTQTNESNADIETKQASKKVLNTI